MKSLLTGHGKSLSSSVITPTHSSFSSCSIAPSCYAPLNLFILHAAFSDSCLQCRPMRCNAATCHADERSRKSYSFHLYQPHFCNGSSACLFFSFFVVSYISYVATMQTNGKHQHPTQHCSKWKGLSLLMFAYIQQEKAEVGTPLLQIQNSYLARSYLVLYKYTMSIIKLENG